MVGGMDRPLDRLAEWPREHPLAVDAALAGAIWLVTVLGSTVALSVVERRQENGLLRTLGLTRGPLRGLLASVLPARRAARTSPVAAIAG